MPRPRPQTDIVLQEGEQTAIASVGVEVAVTRAAQEIQAALVVAKRFPRDENAAYARIIKSCQRKALAEDSQYAYQKGDKLVTGPTIRMAEMLARCWGNMDFGIVEVEQRSEESTMLAYAWDLETNTRQTRTFTVRHERYTKKGTYRLEDPRDIYEATANVGARRVRACILGLVPGDVVEAATAQCDKTIREGEKTPLSDRIRSMLVAFEGFDVSQEQIAARIGHSVESMTETELLTLRKVWAAIRDNFSSVSDYFAPITKEPKPGQSATDALAEKLGAKPQGVEGKDAASTTEGATEGATAPATGSGGSTAASSPPPPAGKPDRIDQVVIALQETKDGATFDEAKAYLAMKTRTWFPKRNTLDKLTAKDLDAFETAIKNGSLLME